MDQDSGNHPYVESSGHVSFHVNETIAASTGKRHEYRFGRTRQRKSKKPCKPVR